MTQTMNKKDILSVMEEIVRKIKADTGQTAYSAYGIQRNLISRTFSSTSGPNYDYTGVLQRLVIIDALYSTNADRTYFALNDLADAIFSLGEEQVASDYFKNMVSQTPNSVDANGLFDSRTTYGIRKDAGEGTSAVSLLSKYAYYALMSDASENIGFPIYDSLARAMYPKLCAGLHVVPPCKAVKNIEMTDYLAHLNALRLALFGDCTEKVFGHQQYDVIDAYLWRMGKFSNGNLSLLLGKEDYKKFVENIGLAKSQRKKSGNGKAEKPVDSSEFNKEVLRRLKSGKYQPFAGLSVEKHMDCLYNHWRKYWQ